MNKLSVIAIFVIPVLLVLATVSVGADDHAYVGTKDCKKCHIKEWKSWSETKMAKAYDTLKPGVAADRKTELGLEPDKDYTTDDNCVKCHVTGFGAEGGFVSEADTPELVGVGCEMCHGAGGTFTQDGYMTLKNKEYKKADLVAVGLVDTVTEEQCVVCHNENVPIEGYTFDFETKKAEGTHENYELKYAH
ncbi:MAG: cytochrome c family protein [Thermoanaerobaculia bacterium]